MKSAGKLNGIGCTVIPCGRFRKLGDDGSLVAILEITTDARKVGNHLDIKLFQFFFWPHARQFENLWAIERASAEDDFM